MSRGNAYGLGRWLAAEVAGWMTRADVVTVVRELTVITVGLHVPTVPERGAA